ncbi:efflux RND transporter periplasmic adaptor subunit [Rubrimonas cliftonensis]|uniref:Membrane fusion protein, multidrug efflux system n=1 Tax=Rubrimonas cliftonensis TaxID=89524 RepID=A0A1H4C6I4_9RHOB|nr:efflux RND transporter periplasmic adaptor subunit [Rubrimonas cliftonensis]SEA55702.1 membrane fusion protein, multidrug efflux system [Rubrimonas cliftonensis]
MAGLMRQLAVLGVLAGAGYGGWILWQDARPAAQEAAQRARSAPGVVVSEVALGSVERSVSAVGVATPVQSVRLAPAASGRVVERAVSGGETVEAGEVVLKLDEETQAAALQDAVAELSRASNAFDRSRTLQEQGRIAQTAYETAAADLATAEAALAQARKALADRTLRAPFGGIVGFLDVDAGAMVASGDAIGTLDDISALDVDFNVPERFFGEVQNGATIRATTEIFRGETFTGFVTAIDRRIDTVSRSFKARARVPNPGLRIPAGAFMRVTLVLEARDGVIAPEEAVAPEGGRSYVYVVTPEDRAERREVRLGQRLPGRVEVLEGLSPGERVVVRGVQKARDGAPVEVIGVEPPETSAPPTSGSGAIGDAAPAVGGAREPA